MDRFENNLNRLLREYVSEEDLQKLISGDQNLINEVNPVAKAKFNAYLNIRRGMELCEDREFNELVEKKAQDYRKRMAGRVKQDRERLLLEEEQENNQEEKEVLV